MQGRAVRIMLRAGAALLLAAPFSAQAETRQALVIAERSVQQEIGQAGRDALAVSRALLAAGFDVRRLENPAVLPDPPAEAPDVMLIYVSGDIEAQDGRQVLLLNSGAIDLTQLAARFPAARQQILLAEACPANSGANAERSPETNPPRLAEGAGLIAHSPGVCADAPRLTTVLMSALKRPGTELGSRLDKAGLVVATGPDWRGFTAVEGRAELAGGDMLIIDQPLQTVGGAQGLGRSGRPAAQPAVQRGSDGGGVQIFNAAAPVQPLRGDRLARPLQAGRPEPSIIVGERSQDPQTAPQDDVVGQALGTSFEDRQRIRQQDPGGFASLVDSGAFDPPSDQLAAAIQSELLRMNCYTSTVDGVWGNGSRQAVDRYFEEIGGSPATREPEVPLFRQIALKDDARCPDVVAQPAARSAPEPAASRQATTTRSTNRATRQPARQSRRQAPAQRQENGAQPQISPNALGSGIFR